MNVKDKNMDVKEGFCRILSQVKCREREREKSNHDESVRCSIRGKDAAPRVLRDQKRGNRGGGHVF